MKVYMTILILLAGRLSFANEMICTSFDGKLGIRQNKLYVLETVDVGYSRQIARKKIVTKADYKMESTNEPLTQFSTENAAVTIYHLDKNKAPRILQDKCMGRENQKYVYLQFYIENKGSDRMIENGQKAFNCEISKGIHRDISTCE